MSKVLAVGDIHTKTWIFDLVETVIDKYDHVIFCGDFADNFGANAYDSLNTWYRLQLMFMIYPDKIKAVRGNHDYIYTERTPTSQSGYDPETQILLNTKEHLHLKHWLRKLPLVLEVDGVTYAHAGIDERWNGEFTMSSIWNNISPIWTRPEWAQYKNIKQVVGHTPQKTVNEVQPGIWLIDTFSQHRDGTPYGDGTTLEIIDGKLFKKIQINANHNNTSSVKIDIP